MINIEKKKDNELRDIIVIIKLSAILFCIVALVSNLYTNGGFQFDYDAIKVEKTISTGMVLSLIYLGVSIVTKKGKKDGDFYSILVQRIVYNTIFICIILISGANKSDYKFIYLFLVMQTTLEYGMLDGLLITILASVSLLSMDYIWFDGDFLQNSFIQNDLILVGVFILLAWIMGYFIKNSSKKVSELVSLVNKDSLTGLFNLEYLNANIDEIIKNPIGNKEGIGLVLFDIDYFKEYNEVYGRLAGDEVLKYIAALLRECLDEDQIAARLSGGLFGVLLLNSKLEKTISLGESIRQSINDEQFEGEENQPNGRITVTVGISHYPDSERDLELLLKSAKEALSKGKILNRNSVEVYKDIEEIIIHENKSFIDTAKSLIVKINDKDKFSYTHIQRVVMFARILAKELKLSKEETEILKYAAFIHDIGKFNIKKEILSKKTSLSEEEWEEMRKHPLYSVELMKATDMKKDIEPIILHHHERFDGTGYPDKLKGEEIPYLARVLTVIDSFDAMTSHRPYNRIMTYTEAIRELRENSGSQFDPKIVEAFIKSFNIYND